MLNIQAKRHIRFATVETPTAWLVVAVLLENRGNEMVAITEPKVVKVIPKAQKIALKGHASSQTGLYLLAPTLKNSQTQSTLVSPYVPSFGFAQENVIMWLLAQPPTFK